MTPKRIIAKKTYKEKVLHAGALPHPSSLPLIKSPDKILYLSKMEEASKRENSMEEHSRFLVRLVFKGCLPVWRKGAELKTKSVLEHEISLNSSCVYMFDICVCNIFVRLQRSEPNSGSLLLLLFDILFDSLTVSKM